jgi:hypothetical protein
LRWHLAFAQRLDLALHARKLVEPFLRDAALAVASATDCSILARSNGSRRAPFSPFLITVISRSCTRSKVVKRAPQFSHWRRRRMAVLSSVGRILHLAVVIGAKGQRKSVGQLGVDREAGAQGFHFGGHAGFDLRIALGAILAKPSTTCGDPLADLGELGLAKAARGAGGRAQTDAAGQQGLFAVEGDRVLVAGDAGAVQRLSACLPLAP